MRVSPEAVPTSPSASYGAGKTNRQPADLIYQTVTIAAILLVLGSLWAF